MTEKRKREKWSRLWILLLLVAGVLTVSTAGVTLARYLSSTAAQGAAVAKPFYFSSDKLSGAPIPPYFQVQEPGAEDAVEFTLELRNYVDSLRCTDEDITYSCVALSASGAPLGEAREGTLKQGGERRETITLSLPRSAFYRENGEMGTVTVTAATSSPYEKAISCTLGFMESQGALQWSLSDEAGAVVLSLGGGAGESVTVTWPSSLTPDLSNTLFSGSSAQSVTFPVESGGRYALTFLKADDAAYTKADFTVTTQ